MKHYELTVILRNKDLDNLKAKVREILTKNSATITREDPWGVKRLAYLINGEREGYYDFMLVDSEYDAVKKIGNEFNLNPNILRYMFIALDEEKTA